MKGLINVDINIHIAVAILPFISQMIAQDVDEYR